ncbi:(2Fe-2S)-binding protein [Carboxydothermus hydrogenoformans]|uniref:Iron-sulfur cluster-binding protein n=1 Tax=Carboxydothermus hydrogenoformans (strain ATCC BAA-161 / DSM 6008 / Z-2901) TaxID=246194 RepID=Q3ACM6_CARHZ|nr:(2Fe-2S)-binding protein [Carboxydothermus hydrogenoformans]ABB14277.1 iron-sulfur cluster-binding protein [Carboxydothermus hydrogenoformans Z-2901]
MRVVNMLAQIDYDKCIGCQTCAKVCPVLAIKIENKKPVINAEMCRGCAACEQRCPQYAINMVKREEPFTVYVDPSTVDAEKIEELCKKARLHPEQIICYCTATRAEEVAAAILKGAKSPEEISLQTGVRTGCKVECIEPILRLLEAAGITPEKPEGYQWYGRTPTVWEIPESVKEKYSSRGFYFDEDIKLLDKVLAAKSSRKEDK